MPDFLTVETSISFATAGLAMALGTSFSSCRLLPSPSLANRIMIGHGRLMTCLKMKPSRK
ncbi:hypothetical protein D3C71_2163210 [compost metagenome]